MSPKLVSTLAIVIAAVFADFAGASPPPEDMPSTTAAETTATETFTPADDSPSRIRSAAKTIPQNLAGSVDFSTLTSAIKAAGLESTLAAPGPFTVFAPTNLGFSRLPPKALDAIMKPQNKSVLSSILSHHVVRGMVSSSDLMEKIRSGGGKTELTTLTGQKLTAKLDGPAVTISDENGNVTKLTQRDQPQANGLIHAIDGILLPKPAR
jgi:uncharacterized surface protein with fasciclin (FAS1) repeats